MLDLPPLPRVAVEAVGEQAVRSNHEDAVKVRRRQQQTPEQQGYYKDCKRVPQREEAPTMAIHAAQEVKWLEIGEPNTN
jgi:uncharacterized protein (DUF111 family)